MIIRYPNLTYIHDWTVSVEIRRLGYVDERYPKFEVRCGCEPYDLSLGGSCDLERHLARARALVPLQYPMRFQMDDLQVNTAKEAKTLCRLASEHDMSCHDLAIDMDLLCDPAMTGILHRLKLMARTALASTLMPYLYSTPANTTASTLISSPSGSNDIQTLPSYTYQVHAADSSCAPCGIHLEGLSPFTVCTNYRAAGGRRM